MQKNIMLLEKDKFLSKQKDVISIISNISSQLQTRQISLVGLKIIFIKKFDFHQSIKATIKFQNLKQVFI